MPTMLRSTYEADPVTVTLPFRDWDRIRSALYAFEPEPQEIGRKIGQAMSDAYDQYLRSKR